MVRKEVRKELSSALEKQGVLLHDAKIDLKNEIKKEEEAEKALKKTEAYSWLKEINSQTLQHALRHLETAYANFFKGRAKFPRFHSKKHGGSFAIPQHFKVEGNRIIIPKFKGGIRFAKSQDVQGELKNMTVSVTPAESITFASWRRLRSRTWRKPI